MSSVFCLLFLVRDVRGVRVPPFRTAIAALFFQSSCSFVGTAVHRRGSDWAGGGFWLERLKRVVQTLISACGKG